MIAEHSRVLVTGASGFVGRELTKELVQQGFDVVGTSRRPGLGMKVVGALGPDTDWRAVLAGCDAVVHLAARVHVMEETALDSLAEFRRENVAGTEALARQAAAQGVKHFVFVSSIKVNGEQTHDIPFRATDAPRPRDPYGISKHEAEQALHRVCEESAMEYTIVRPPLVYGPGVRANFQRLMLAVQKGIPLPLGGITQNSRSLVSVKNLASLIIECLRNPRAANETFLVSDGEDLSTAGLVQAIAVAMDKKPRLLTVPACLFRLLGKLVGKEAIIERLCGSLAVDISRNKVILGWTPRTSVASALRETVARGIGKGTNKK